MYAASATSLGDQPAATAIALMVAVLGTTNGRVYCRDAVVGVVPSDV